MIPLFQKVRGNAMPWLLVFVPTVLVAAEVASDAHTLLFVLPVPAFVPLATRLSHATESVAAMPHDAAGGLLDATLGNPTELVIALTAPRAGEYTPVKVSIAGAIVTNGGRSAWFVGVLVPMVDRVFAMTLCLLPPRSSQDDGSLTWRKGGELSAPGGGALSRIVEHAPGTPA